MNEFNFKINDMVYWVDSTGTKHLGKVIGLPKGDKNYWEGYTIFFGKDSTFYKLYSMERYKFSKGREFILAGPPKSIEERVLDKSKILWNKSKYVQKHPHAAY